MYTIKQAGLRSGVSVPLLRAWERRYGIVEPARTAAGYRLYSDAAVERLRTMRRLVNEGWSASAAARAIQSGDVPPEPLGEVTPSASDAAKLRSDATVAPELAAGLVERFVDAAARMDASGVELVLDEAFAAGTFEQASESVVLPALRALGNAWQAGTLDVAAEHAASSAVGRRLGAAFAAAGRPSAQIDVLVGLPPGSRHELGALAFATAARRAGIPLLYLGADVPEASWLAAASRTRARAAVVAVPTDRDAGAAAQVLDALRRLDPQLILAVGGAGASAVVAGGIVDLSARVSVAASELRDRLARPDPTDRA